MQFAHLDIENELWNEGFENICGVDEVGRGCFAGPVVSAAVIFPKGVKLPEGIADSKLLTPKKRKELSERIREVAKCFSIGEVCVPCINKDGIGVATQQSFVNAVEGLETQPDFILIDAFYIKGLPKEKQKPIIGGDKISASIAAASIIAKVYRDELMEKLAEEFPNYDFGVHKGYGTQKHREAIKQYGLSPLHRTSFNLSKFL